MITASEGIDVSGHNPLIDLSNSPEIEWAYVKVLEGTTDIDGAHPRHVESLRRQGRKIGPYCYHHPAGTIEESADVFVRLIEPFGFELPSALDLETRCGTPKSKAHAGCKAHQRAEPQQVVDSSVRWLERVHNLTDRRPILYTGPSFLTELADDGADISPLFDYWVWLAAYVSTLPNVAGADVLIHQWTDGGGTGPPKLTGGHKVDRNRSLLTTAQLCSLGIQGDFQPAIEAVDMHDLMRRTVAQMEADYDARNSNT